MINRTSFSKKLIIPITNFISMLEAEGVRNNQIIYGKSLPIKDWPPFTAKISQIIPWKTSKTFVLILSDDKNKCLKFKLFLGSQLSPLIFYGDLKKGDLICVKEYAITRMSFGRRIYHAYEINKK